jgi:type I restriction enzyme M protein
MKQKKGSTYMLGAIIGDLVGSPFEFNSPKTKHFPLFRSDCRPTDDSLMTIAVGCACVHSATFSEISFKESLCKYMREIGALYPSAGYGSMFYYWLFNDNAGPYESIGNGSAMRVSPIGWAFKTLAETEKVAKWSAEVTHNSDEGIRGAQAIAAAVFLARNGSDKDEIRDYIQSKYYDLGFTLDEIRPTYESDVTCDGSVPQAIVAFLESTDFEDAIRNAMSLGGDCDTQACMAGAIAEAFYGIPEDIQEKAFELLDETVTDYYLDYSDELYSRYI